MGRQGYVRFTLVRYGRAPAGCLPLSLSLSLPWLPFETRFSQ